MNLRPASAPRARPWSIWGAALTLGLMVLAAPGQADEVVVERVGQWPRWQRGEAMGVAVSGNYAYVADARAGLQVIDVSDPANPRRVGGYDTSGWAGDELVATGFQVLAAVFLQTAGRIPTKLPG